MKVSVIMQVYLGEYPGSRSDSDRKFIRAVQSFLDQTDKDSELIIAADGCMIAHKLYYDLYKKEDRIKYVYIDKDTPNMYEGGDMKYYRGLPRQVARSLVTGEITTYMDSDDFLLPDAIFKIKQQWKLYAKQDITCLYNSTWIDNEAMLLNKKYESVLYNNTPFKVKGLDSNWITSSMSHLTLVLSSTWSMIHKSNFLGKWEDTIGSPSEDVLFSKKLQQTGKVGVINEAYYIRCHYSGMWDY